MKNDTKVLIYGVVIGLDIFVSIQSIKSHNITDTIISVLVLLYAMFLFFELRRNNAKEKE